jgi:hypothetical protein
MKEKLKILLTFQFNIIFGAKKTLDQDLESRIWIRNEIKAWIRIPALKGQ